MFQLTDATRKKEFKNTLRRTEFPFARPSAQRFRRARKIQENEIRKIFTLEKHVPVRRRLKLR